MLTARGLKVIKTKLIKIMDIKVSFKMYVCMNLDRCNLDDIPTNTLLFDSF